MTMTVEAPGIKEARYTIRDVEAICSIDDQPFRCDIMISFMPLSATLELGWLRRLIDDSTARPHTAESLAHELAQRISLSRTAHSLRVVVRHEARDGIELEVVA